MELLSLCQPESDSRHFFLSLEAPAKLLKARGNCHSGQAKRDPESRIFRQFWIPAFAGMTNELTLPRIFIFKGKAFSST
jgi:hypothetical protein